MKNGPFWAVFIDFRGGVWKFPLIRVFGGQKPWFFTESSPTPKKGPKNLVFDPILAHFAGIYP
jgi:hypothetical protein